MVDPYIQGNGTLKNKLGITEYSELNNAEKDITFTKFLNIEQTYKTKFDVEYLKSIHKHIFEDVFDWAGQFRTVPIYKQEIVIPGLSLEYAPVKEIEPRLKDILNRMIPKWKYTKKMLEQIDYLVDGPFVEAKKDITLRFRGSSNQRIIDVKKSLETGKVVLWEEQ